MAKTRLKTWRGKTEAELRKMSLEEVLPLLNSRERRSIKRLGKSIQLKKLLKKVEKVKNTNQNKVIRTQVRNAPILPQWLGLTFAVHNGKEWKTVEVTLDNLGRRLGEFAHSTGPVRHSGPGVGATRSSKFIPLK